VLRQSQLVLEGLLNILPLLKDPWHALKKNMGLYGLNS